MTFSYKLTKTNIETETDVELSLNFSGSGLNLSGSNRDSLVIKDWELSVDSLIELTEKYPEFFLLSPTLLNKIDCDWQTYELLSLLLKPESTEVPIDWNEDHLKVFQEAFGDELPENRQIEPEDWTLEVNGDNWVTTDSITFFPDVLPTELIQETWASVSFIETASMTSGIYFSEIGRMTRFLGAIIDSRDEEGYFVEVFLLPEDYKPIAQLIVDWATTGSFISDWDFSELQGRNGTLLNAIGSLLKETVSFGNFPGLAAFTDHDIGQISKQKSYVFDPNDSAHWNVVLSENPNIRSEVQSILKKKYPTIPEYQFVDSSYESSILDNQALTEFSNWVENIVPQKDWKQTLLSMLNQMEDKPNDDILAVVKKRITNARTSTEALEAFKKYFRI